MSCDFNSATDRLHYSGGNLHGAMPFTIGCWFRTDVISGDLHMLHESVNGAATHFYNANYKDSDSDVHVDYDDNNGPAGVQTTTTVSEQVWHPCLALHVSGFVHRVQVDSDLVTNSASNRSPSTDRFTVGNSNDLANPFDGRIEHLAMWDVELNADERQSFCVDRIDARLIRPRSLIHFWPLVGADAVDMICQVDGSTFVNTGVSTSDRTAPILPAGNSIFRGFG